jgi:SAM-dependent methyltransferase
MNLEKYAMRMEDNVDDKLIVLDFIEQEDQDYNILDFGCGSGSIYGNLSASHPNAIVVGFDKSDFMIDRAQKNHPTGTFFSKIEDLSSFIEKSGKFEYIILNSILHEVYSYQDGFVSVVELLEKLSKYQTKTGQFIVRDGILDIESVTDIHQIDQYLLKKPTEAMEFLNKYTYLSPFPNHLEIKDDCIIGPWYEVREFLNKYTWGFDSLYRESQEIVNFATLEMYRRLFNKLDFSIRNKRLVTQEDYFKYLGEIVDIGNIRWNTKIIFSASKKV